MEENGSLTVRRRLSLCVPAFSVIIAHRYLLLVGLL